MIIMKEVGVGLEKDDFQTIAEGMTAVVRVGLDQFQELVLIEIESESDHFAKDCPTLKTEKEKNKCNRSIIWMKNRPH